MLHDSVHLGLLKLSKMCGITASLALESRISTHLTSKEVVRKQLSQEIDNSLEIVKHRGPDARGQWISSDARVGKAKNQLRCL